VLEEEPFDNSLNYDKQEKKIQWQEYASHSFIQSSSGECYESNAMNYNS